VRLGETINRYLDLTRLESGAQPLHPAPISARELIESCVSSLALSAAEKRIRLRLQVDPELPLLQVDAQLFTQAISNLIGNAIKYSPSGSEVVISAVSARSNQNEVLISVSDQGPGIPIELREKIFEKFYRLERDASSEIIGTGLGLPLVKEIVEQHGGSVTVDGELGKGSIFTLRIAD
jgi:signal transduction histidine kinase